MIKRKGCKEIDNKKKSNNKNTNEKEANIEPTFAAAMRGTRRAEMIPPRVRRVLPSGLATAVFASRASVSRHSWIRRSA